MRAIAFMIMRINFNNCIAPFTIHKIVLCFLSHDHESFQRLDNVLQSFSTQLIVDQEVE